MNSKIGAISKVIKELSFKLFKVSIIAIKANIGQIILFIVNEYLNEDNNKDSLFEILLKAFIPPIRNAIKNEMNNPSIDFQ